MNIVNQFFSSITYPSNAVEYHGDHFVPCSTTLSDVDGSSHTAYRWQNIVQNKLGMWCKTEMFVTAIPVSVK